MKQLFANVDIISRKEMLKIFISVILVIMYAGTCTDKEAGSGVNDIRYKECRELGEDIYVCFDSVIADSRCPVDVVCIWEGEAAAGFRVSTYDGTHFLQMKVGEDTVVGDYKIIFEDLVPYPNTKVEVDPEDYIARVVVEG